MRRLPYSIPAGLLLLVLCLGVERAQAAAGSLDTTFGTNGVTVTSVANTDSIVNSMLLLSGDKILVFAGGATLVQFTSNGALDTTFGTNGVVVLSTPIGGSLAVQPNGKIVIGGIVTPSGGGAELGVERLNADGSPDSSFGSGGVAVVSLGTRAPGSESAVLVETSGDIVVGTQLFPTGRRAPTQTALARFTSIGDLDPSFGSGGLSIQTGPSGCSALAELSTGELLVVAAEPVAQYTANGNVEPTVTGGTIVAQSQSSSAFLPSIFDASGDYLLGGELFVGEESRGHNSSAQVIRFSQTGTQVADATFHYAGSGGSGIEALVQGLAAEANGDVVAVGDQITFAQSGVTTVNGLARLKPENGSLVLDASFGNGGTVVNNMTVSTGVVVQSTGNIVTAGIANNALVITRYLGQ